jgi:hypothetical protein
MNNSITSVFEQNGKRRSYGVYSTGLDRFFLIDSYDLWTTLETANLLSSKIPNIVYLMPYEHEEIDNTNCFNFGITDHSTQKMGNTSLLFTTQTPVVRTLFGKGAIKWHDMLPEVLDPYMLFELKKYANFVHLHSYAIRLTETILKYEETENFSKSYIDTSAKFKTTHERSGLEKGIYFRLRQILYLSSSVEEAEKLINSVWETYSSNIPYAREKYYYFLEKTSNISLTPTPQDYSNYSG